MMTAPFDIFEKEKSGTVLWLGSAISMEDAQVRIQRHAASTSGEYLVLNQQTGNKLIVKFNENVGE
jgi:hypothetical protein